MLDPLGLEIPDSGKLLVWMLGNKLGPLEMWLGALNCWPVSPASPVDTFEKVLLIPHPEPFPTQQSACALLSPRQQSFPSPSMLSAPASSLGDRRWPEPVPDLETS